MAGRELPHSVGSMGIERIRNRTNAPFVGQLPQVLEDRLDLPALGVRERLPTVINQIELPRFPHLLPGQFLEFPALLEELVQQGNGRLFEHGSRIKVLRHRWVSGNSSTWCYMGFPW